MDRRVVTVFGGSGFIGRHLVRRLAADGWIIRVAVRDPEAALFLQPMGDVAQIIRVRANVSDPAQVASAVANAEAVINLVGILYEKGKRTFQRIHVEGAQNVARAARAAGAGRLIQMSAIGADPDSAAEYGRTKAGGEQAALGEFPNASIIRPSVVFGPEDDFFNRFAAMARIMPILPVFPTRFQPVYVGDVAEAMMKVLVDPGTRGLTYELGGPEVISFREMLQIVLKETRRKALLVRMPIMVAEMEAWFLEKLPVPPLTRDQVKLLEQDNVVTPGARGFSELGISPTGVETIVPTYLHRFRPPVRHRLRAD